METLKITSADVLFVLLGAIMILAMHAGFAFLELGTVRRKNQVNALVKIMVDFAVSTIAYFFIGYGIAYGVSFFAGAETGQHQHRVPVTLRRQAPQWQECERGTSLEPGTMLEQLQQWPGGTEVFGMGLCHVGARCSASGLFAYALTKGFDAFLVALVQDGEHVLVRLGCDVGHLLHVGERVRERPLRV